MVINHLLNGMILQVGNVQPKRTFWEDSVLMLTVWRYVASTGHNEKKRADGKTVARPGSPLIGPTQRRLDGHVAKGLH